MFFGRQVQRKQLRGGALGCACYLRGCRDVGDAGGKHHMVVLSRFDLQFIPVLTLVAFLLTLKVLHWRGNHAIATECAKSKGKA